MSVPLLFNGGGFRMTTGGGCLGWARKRRKKRRRYVNRLLGGCLGWARKRRRRRRYITHTLSLSHTHAHWSLHYTLNTPLTVYFIHYSSTTIHCITHITHTVLLQPINAFKKEEEGECYTHYTRPRVLYSRWMCWNHFTNIGFICILLSSFFLPYIVVGCAGRHERLRSGSITVK